MRRVLTLLMTAVFSLSLVGGAAAQTDEPVTTSVVAADSPLFFIQHLLDGWEEFITFDETQKAAVLAKIADNRLAEAAQMLAAGNAERAAELVEQMQDALAKAAEKIAGIQEKKDEKDEKDENGDEKSADQRRTEEDVVDHVLSRLQRNLERQQASLQKALDNVENERAREAITNAMEKSKRGLENAMERVQKRGDEGRPEGTPGGKPEGTPGGKPERAGTGGKPEGTPGGKPEGAGTGGKPEGAGRPTTVPGGRP